MYMIIDSSICISFQPNVIIDAKLGYMWYVFKILNKLLTLGYYNIMTFLFFIILIEYLFQIINLDK